MSGKATTKLSRNRQRKAAYAGQGSKASRNENAIAAPIVGRFVMKDVTTTCKRCDGSGLFHDELAESVKCKKCDGVGSVPERRADGLIKQVQVIVHDEKRAAPVATESVGKVASTADAAKRRRQESAWTRCRFASTGHDIEGGNCRSCGCPASEAAVQS